MGTAQTASKIALRKWPRESLEYPRITEEQARFLLGESLLSLFTDRSPRMAGSTGSLSLESGLPAAVMVYDES